MYQQHFALTELPFSIVPNSRFLYQSRRHKEAIFQIQAGLGEGGGFAILTGEVGTGKTTISKSILKTLAENTRAGVILNPTFSNLELLEAICDEFDLAYDSQSSLKQLNQIIYRFLLDNHANRIQTLLIIDEAQHLSAEVLEQLRLLTNLETESHKLLKVLLIGQPELQQKLQMPQLRQLAQRMTGRYHLLPLNQDETRDYIKFRLSLAGGSPELFSGQSIKHIARQTQGIPRLINLVCDASLKRAYSLGEAQPSNNTVEAACEDVMSFQTGSISQVTTNKESIRSYRPVGTLSAIVIGISLSIGAYLYTPELVKPWLMAEIKNQHPQVEAITETTLVFPSELKALLNRGNSSEAALAELYQLWGYRASVLDQLCLDDNQTLFRCELAESPLDELSADNTPVVLSLTLDGQPRYAVLQGVSANRVQLQLAGKVVEFDKQWLETIWQGQYRHIWKGYWSETLKPGMKGEPITLLDKYVSSVLGEQESGSDLFDEDLKRKVELFQRWQGLTVDGIAGERTLRLLERLAQPDAPKLNALEESSNV